ncbi:hypothetical protein [Bradyrhizobium sp. USDA 3364]
MGGAIRNLYDITQFFSVFVETGTNLGHTTAFVAKHFAKVHTIELSRSLHEDTKRKLSHIRNIDFIHGDSAEVLRDLCATIEEPAVFYLDAHWSGGVTAHGDEEVPLYHELASIARRPFCDLIIVDDYRLFGKKGKTGTIGHVQYPPIEFDWRNITVKGCLEFFPETQFCREFVVRDDRLFLLKRQQNDPRTPITLQDLGV